MYVLTLYSFTCSANIRCLVMDYGLALEQRCTLDSILTCTVRYPTLHHHQHPDKQNEKRMINMTANVNAVCKDG